MDKLFSKKENCCGCGACVSACPKNAITLVEDEYGFEYPQINTKLCINCKKCENVCIYKEDNNFLHKIEKVYAGVTESTDISKSASGGTFAAIATNFVKNGGAVCGAVSEITNNKFAVNHILSDNLADVEKMLGSKYVQSHTESIFRQIKDKLRSGKEILFSGTPCQVSALKTYLGKDYNNLYTVDLICHGVPNTKIVNDFIKSKLSSKSILTNFAFRDTSVSNNCVSKICYIKHGKEKELKIPQNLNSFYCNFVVGNISRNSCYECKFACPDRVGDLTLGDFWGAENHNIVDNKFDNSKGINCILVNTKKGQELLEKNKENLSLKQSEFAFVAEQNGQVKNPLPMPKSRKAVLELYKDKGYKKIENDFKKRLGYRYFIYILVSKVPLKLKKIIKKIIIK